MSSERSSSQQQNSKRQEFREMRQQRERRKRIAVIFLIVVGALLVVAAVVAPSVRNALTPTTTPTVQVSGGVIESIAPGVHPQASGRSMGDPNAPVKVDVWEDFQCPACVQFTQTVEAQLAKTYVIDGKVYYTFHVFPFLDDYSTETKESDQAANASLCASEQGRFWDYHDMLFANWNGENDGAFADDRLKAFASTLGLDMPAFEACFVENRYQAQITKDMDDGIAMGVNGTPSVFVNGKIIMPGYVPGYEDMVAAIEAALEEALSE